MTLADYIRHRCCGPEDPAPPRPRPQPPRPADILQTEPVILGDEYAALVARYSRTMSPDRAVVLARRDVEQKSSAS